MLRQRVESLGGGGSPVARTLLLDSRPVCLSDAPAMQRYSCGEQPDQPREFPLAPGVEQHAHLAVIRRNIGLGGYAAGPRVHVIDWYGLADPLAARLRLKQRGRPGHEKALPNEGAIACFAVADVPVEDPARVAAARAVLACGDLAELQRAVVEGRLTPQRFLANMRLFWRLTRLRIPADPPGASANCAGGARIVPWPQAPLLAFLYFIFLFIFIFSTLGLACLEQHHAGCIRYTG